MSSSQERLEAQRLAKDIANMVYLKESLGGYNPRQQARMYHSLVNMDDALTIAVNSFKLEIELLNRANNEEEMADLAKTAVNDALMMDQYIEGHFKQIKYQYMQLKTTFDNVQTLEKLLNDGANN